MTEQEFFYWLQGYFELRDSYGPTPPSITCELSVTQVACIKRHVDLVRAAKGLLPGRELVRVEFLVELLQDEKLRADGREGFTAKIRECVHNQFEHVIDPKAGGAEQQAKLDQIHGHPPHKPGEPVMRC